jgi:GPH family glycoside/pentoside/hexuronide:cation symporter
MVDQTAVVAIGEDAKHAHVLPPLKQRHMAGFAIGDVVEGALGTAQGTFLLFYLNQVCGLSGSLAGAALFITLLVDSFLDPLIGYTSDNTRSALGRRHPFMFAAVIQMGLAIALLFSLPRIENDLILFAYVVGCLMLLRIGHSSFMLPYAALGAEIARDYRERSALGSWRTLYSIVGTLAIVFIGFSVFMKGDTGLIDRNAYVGFGWTTGLIVAGAAIACGAFTLRLRHRMHSGLTTQGFNAKQFGAELREVGGNKSFRVLFLCILVFWIAQGTAGGLALHANRYFWALPTSVIQIIPVFAAAGTIIGIPIAAIVLRFAEKQSVCVIAMGLFCVVQFTPVVLRILHILPEEGPALYHVLYGVNVIAGMVVTSVGITFGAMMADAADEHEFLYGSRREGLYFAGLTFSAKAAIAFGSLIGGVGLDAIGFPAGAAEHVVIAPETLRDLGIISGPGAALITFVGVIILTGYNLTAKRHEEITTELARRKEAPPAQA